MAATTNSTLNNNNLTKLNYLTLNMF